jgi:mycofactocin glycosyltransferase
MRAAVDASAGPSSWRLSPGVIRLRQRRLAGGAPYRVVRLSEQADADLAALLGTRSVPAAGSRTAQLTASLVRYGLLLAPTPVDAELRVSDVTVVIPALSTAGAVEAVLARIPAGVEVIVTDDGSQPALATGLAARPGLAVLRHDVPRGPAAARNAGARLARTPWIAFLDADIMPPDGWLAALLTRGADPSVVAVAPRIVSAKSAGLAGFLEVRAGALDLGPVPADAAPGRPVSYVPSAVLLVRRESLTAVGGFDEDLQVGEDVDLIWRLCGTGRIRYEPDVVCQHRPRPSVRAVLGRRFDYGTSAAALAQRHPGMVRHADVSIWSFVPWVIGVGAHPAVGAALAAGAITIAPRGLPDLPPDDARLLAARGQRLAAQALGKWLLRPMWPLTLALAVLAPRTRKGLALAVFLGALRRSAGRPEPLGAAISGLAASVVDDVAYSTGVWAGCVREGTLAPLVPRVRWATGRGRTT